MWKAIKQLKPASPRNFPEFSSAQSLFFPHNTPFIPISTFSFSAGLTDPPLSKL